MKITKWVNKFIVISGRSIYPK